MLKQVQQKLADGTVITAKAYKYLGLLRRVFNNCHSIRAIKLLYLTLVWSQLTHCSQLWNPYLIKDTKRVQRWATKFILSDYVSDYKTCLLRLGILPLMYMLDLCDIMFFVNLKLDNSHLILLNSSYTTTYHSVLPTPGHHLLTN